MWDKHDLQNGNPEIGVSTMTMHLLTLICLCANFWLKTKLLSFHAIPSLQIWRRAAYFLSQNTK
jgi:hypothetical protein